MANYALQHNCSLFVSGGVFVFHSLENIKSIATINFCFFYSSLADLSSEAPPTCSHIWLLCITLVMTLLEGQRWPFSPSSQRRIFRPTVCELYPRHPITKDSCILKAAGILWQTTEGPELMKERKNHDKKSYTKSNKEDALIFLKRPLLQKTLLGAGLWTSLRAQRQAYDE